MNRHEQPTDERIDRSVGRRCTSLVGARFRVVRKAAKPGDKTTRNPAHRLVLVEHSSRSRRGNRARSHRRAAAERGLVHFTHQQLACGPKPTADPSAEQIQQLLRRNKRLTEQLRKAEIIIDVQNKVARLLGLTLAEPDPKDLS